MSIRSIRNDTWVGIKLYERKRGHLASGNSFKKGGGVVNLRRKLETDSRSSVKLML